MVKFLVILSVFYIVVVVCIYATFIGPKYPPTQGEVWPKPYRQNKRRTFYTYVLNQFTVKVSNKTCQCLTLAVFRFEDSLKILHDIARRYRRARSRKWGKILRTRNVLYHGVIKELVINLKQPCQQYPTMEMNESYSLRISSASVLESDSIWGIIRGLETASQLFYLSDDFCEVRVNKTEIPLDYPAYPHRGFMLDTSRHYISVGNILRTLDAMAINKMNVFHWHIVDDESFPYQSAKYPELSALGAYYSTLVYTEMDIRAIVEYARDRGIRVIPEIDVPGHTRSWGEAFPEILTVCYNGPKNSISGLGPLNPIQNATYRVMQDLFSEIQRLFPDKYFHIGGDEVDVECWLSNPEIQKFMFDNKYDERQLFEDFILKAIECLGNKSTPIYWQEVNEFCVEPLPNNSIVQIWKSNYMKEMIEALESGMKVIFSSEWYLDNLDEEFPKFYDFNPRHMLATMVKKEKLVNIVGGEACMWGEMVDNYNVISRAWPRASAVAEVLWSSPNGTVPPEAYHRLEEQTCRMIRRGIPAEPASGPGFCIV